MPLIEKLTPWQQYVEDWSNCDQCPLCLQRSRIVLARGSVPADIVLVGEAPGVSEDILGVPFAGPAGGLLDHITDAALHGRQISCAWTNLVACFPRLAKEAGDNEPTDKEIKACGNRLREFITLCRPKLIVTVGKLSDRWTPKITEKAEGYRNKPPRWCSLVHPAAILRQTEAQKGLSIQRSIVVLRTAIDDMMEAR